MRSLTVLFPGTFDPITNGHLDLIHRLATLFPKVLVAVSEARHKKPLFSHIERIQLAKGALLGQTNIQVLGFQGLLYLFAKEQGCRLLIRGIRSSKDYTFEYNLSYVNYQLSTTKLETLWFPGSAAFSSISSSLIKELAELGRFVNEWVPDNVLKALKLIYEKN